MSCFHDAGLTFDCARNPCVYCPELEKQAEAEALADKELDDADD